MWNLWNPRARLIILVLAAIAIAVGIGLIILSPKPAILCCPPGGVGPCTKVERVADCAAPNLAGECRCPVEVPGGYKCGEC